MKKIYLPNCKDYTLVDEEDYTDAVKFHWRKDRKGYVVRSVNKNGKTTTTERLHRRIMKPQRGLQVDHIDHNTLDNRKSNLRVCTNAQNCQNRKQARGSSGYEGVCRENSKWLARIQANGKRVRLGLFDTPESAHQVYLEAVPRYFGDFMPREAT